MNKQARVSFFEKISGYYSDGTPLHSVPESEQITKSIRDHLIRLLNTRKGSLPHLYDYGLSDMADIYTRLPNSRQELKNEILATIKKYEPRLKYTRVDVLDFRPLDLRIKLRIVGVINQNDKIVLESSVLPNGKVDLGTV